MGDFNLEISAIEKLYTQLSSNLSTRNSKFELERIFFSKNLPRLLFEIFQSDDSGSHW